MGKIGFFREGLLDSPEGEKDSVSLKCMKGSFYPNVAFSRHMTLTGLRPVVNKANRSKFTDISHVPAKNYISTNSLQEFILFAAASLIILPFALT